MHSSKRIWNIIPQSDFKGISWIPSWLKSLKNIALRTLKNAAKKVIHKLRWEMHLKWIKYIWNVNSTRSTLGHECTGERGLLLSAPPLLLPVTIRQQTDIIQGSFPMLFLTFYTIRIFIGFGIWKKRLLLLQFKCQFFFV